MSSTLSAGHAAREAQRIKDTPCRKSPDAKHTWEQKGMWPSLYEQCKHCDTTIYWK